ncbi:MAG: GAF domain-containing protein [Kofleriaceae bacterium]
MRWELATGTVTWSDELYRIYGLEPRSRAITVDFFLSCIDPDERPRIQREVENALQRRGRFNYVERIVRPTGERRSLDTIGEVIEVDGTVVALIGTCRDITDAARREEQIRFYSDVFAHVEIGLSAWQIDRREDPPVLQLVAFNQATEHLAGGPLIGRLGQTMMSMFPAMRATEMLAKAREMSDRVPIQKVRPFRLNEKAGAPIVAATLFSLPNRHVGLALEDVTSSHNAELIHAGERRALEMLAEGAPLEAILEAIIAAIEDVMTETLGSILLLDDTGTHVKHGAAPRLPHAYSAAIDGAVIGPSAGSCGTAAFLRQPVYVTDIETDPLWENYRELVRPHGLRSCWSSPILANDGHVLGTFALYHREPRAPDESARDLLQRASHVAGIVLERRALDEQLRALTARIEAIREDERTTIARDIHDQLGQALTALKLDLGWLTRRIQEPPLTRKLDEMAHAADDIIRSVRRISSDLRPGLLDDLGLRAAVEWQAEDFTERTGTKCRVRSEIGDLRLERGLATTVFRIFQEALTNVTRHASASQVEVVLVLDHGQLRLDVIDDGIGIPDVGPRNTTLGILGMSERARRLGGDCTVKRQAPRGTVVSVVMPLRFPTEHLGGVGA